MRIGNNPEKNSNRLEIGSYHRVIIPVYIPNLTEEYFKDGLRIFKLCLESLILTSHPKTRISIINNDCCAEVTDYIKNQFDIYDCIDQLLSSKVNLGKVNALYSSIKSNLEPLFTVADADVMFLPDWQKEVEQIMEVYPNAGMVSPVPPLGSLKGSFLRTTIGFAFLHGKPKHEKVKNLEGIQNFQRSIGNEMTFNEENTKYYTLNCNNKKVVIGCGHFMATVRAKVFTNSPVEPSQHKIVGGSEKLYIDKPNDRSGYLKLSTHDNYGYHLGNQYEDWMDSKMDEIRNAPGINSTNDFDFSYDEPNKNYYKLGFIIQKLFYRN